MERRALAALGLLALVALAGCSAAGSLSMEVATDQRIAEEASRSAAPDRDDDRAVVRRAVENGSATVTDGSPPVERGLPFGYDGAYYEVDWNVTDSQPATSVSLEIDYNGSAPAGETVGYDALSPRDRELLDGLLPPRTERRTEGYDFGTGGTYTEPERNRSVLLSGEYEAVRFEGETYPVAVETEPTTLRTYRYTVTTVADSTAAYADRLRERHLFTLSGLSEDERSVVEEAISENGSYYAESDDDEAFRGVLEEFDGRSAIESTEYRGTWLVRYEGEVYVAELSYGGFEGARPGGEDRGGG
jgi:hypothetical protein